MAWSPMSETVNYRCAHAVSISFCPPSNSLLLSLQCQQQVIRYPPRTAIIVIEKILRFEIRIMTDEWMSLLHLVTRRSSRGLLLKNEHILSRHPFPAGSHQSIWIQERKCGTSFNSTSSSLHICHNVSRLHLSWETVTHKPSNECKIEPRSGWSLMKSTTQWIDRWISTREKPDDVGVGERKRSSELVICVTFLHTAEKCQRPIECSFVRSLIVASREKVYSEHSMILSCKFSWERRLLILERLRYFDMSIQFINI